MKKIIIAILCVILSGTIYFFVMGDKKINNENEEHKNFKQALIKSDGTIYGEKDRDWYLEFNIIDDDINNELVLNKNIEDIYILENNNTKINLKNYEIIDNHKEEKYVLRKLKCEFDNKYGDKINLNKLVIKYLDEKEKEFNIGNLNFGDNKIVCIVVPFKFNKNFEKEKIIYMINPKLTLEANGVEEILMNDNGVSNDFMFNGDKLLDEEKLIEQLNREGI